MTFDEMQSILQQVVISQQELQAAQREFHVNQQEIQAAQQEFRVNQQEIQAAQREFQVNQQELQAAQQEFRVNQQAIQAAQWQSHVEMDELRALARSNGRAIQSMLEQATTDRLKREGEKAEHQARMERLEHISEALTNMLVSIDEDRPTILRKLNTIEQTTDSILSRLPPQQ